MRTSSFLRCVLLASAFVAVVVTGALQPARAEQRASPAWWGATSTASSTWHYRVPLTLSAAPPVNATAVFNVDFAGLLAQMGVNGTLDVQSPRVVDAAGTQVPTQEFTDAVYNGDTDPVGNGRGEIRFLTTSTATTYWLYFDITANGTKPSNAAAAIDGNFENAGTVQSNTVAPRGWTVTRAASAIDSQVRGSESVSVTTNGSDVVGGTTRTVDGTPSTGQYSFLLGARSNNESADVTDVVVLTRTIVVPATSPGVLRFRYRVQGWDSGENNVTNNYDYLAGAIVNGTTTTYFMGPQANNYTTYPFAPNKGSGQSTGTQSGYGQFNGFDMDENGNHRSGMTVTRNSQPWWTVTVNLAPYAGRTITLRFSTRHTTQYRSWWHIDDVEWSVVEGTVGTPQGFGASLELPSAAAATQYPGDVLAIRARLDAAGKTGAVVADLLRPDGTTARSGILLYNDGTHGDATSGDALWTNTGGVAAQPTYTFGAGDPAGTWTLVLRAADSSTAASGQPAGLIREPGQPVTPVNGTNFSNVDVQTFTFSPFMSISGKAYRDSNRNGTLDSGEPAASGVYVKLVQAGAVLQVATPDAGGNYSFTGLRAGSFTVLQSVNNNTTDMAPSVPSGWIQSEPVSGGSHAVVLAGGVSATANFGQYPVGSRVSGRVFADTGAGGATALDGVQGASEPPLAGLTITLRDGGGGTLATAVTRGDGQFDLPIPSEAAGTPLTVLIPAVTGHDLARLGVGSTGGTASLPGRTVVFTPAAATDYTGIVASLLPVSTLVQPQAKTVLPGGVAAYPHRFDADANGTVSFSLASAPPATLPGWSAIVYRDNDCNGVIDGADAPLTSAVAVQAGNAVCVVVRDLVPQSASINMANQHQLSASFVVTQGAGFTAAPQVNVDVTTVGASTGSGLTLVKAVRNLTTGTGFGPAGQALPGQSLQYRITFRNDTAFPITNVVVNDFLPAYSVFQGAACGTMPAGLTCAVATAPAVGAATGPLQWNFSGALAPGASGEVTFDWTLSN